MLTWKAIGSFELSLHAVPGFTTPRFRQLLSIRVLTVPMQPMDRYAVKDCLTSVVFQPATNPPSFPLNSPVLELRITSLEPSKLRLSVDPTAPGEESVTVSGGRAVYLHGMSETGFALIRVESPAIESFEVSVPILDWSLTVLPNFGQSNTDALLNPTFPLNYLAALASTDGRFTSGPRPGLDPIAFTIDVSDPSIYTVSLKGQPALFSPGAGMRELEIQPRSPGAATLSIAAANRASAPVRITVRAPRLTAAPSLIGPHRRGGFTFQLEQGSAAPQDNTTVTLRTLDPSKLLLANPSPTSPGVEFLTTIWPAFTSSLNVQFDSLVSEGDAELEISMPGYETSRAKVYFSSPYLSFPPQSSIPNLTVGSDSSASVSVQTLSRPEIPSGSSILVPSDGPFRPGFDPASIPVEFDVQPAGILESVSATPFSQNQSAQLRFKAIAPGEARLVLRTPPGFVDPPSDQAAYIVRTQLPTMSSLCFNNVGFEGVRPCNAFLPADRTITLRSSDPSRLLLSLEQRQPGQPSIELPPGSSARLFFIHGLAKSGQTNLTYRAEGYQDAVSQITHLESTFIFLAAKFDSGPIQVSLASPININLEYCTVLQGQISECPIEGLRPNANPATLTYRIGDSTLLAASPTQISVQPGQNQATLQLRGLRTGSTTLELLTPPGYAAPPRPAVIVRVVP